MKSFSVLTACLALIAVYLVIFERAWLLNFSGSDAGGQTYETDADGMEASKMQTAGPELAENASFSVISVRSTARFAENNLVLRGRSEAARWVEVRAEISGLIILEPLRKGAHVSQGQVLCEINSGTRIANLARAKASLAEARARAEEAAINQRTASELLESGYGSETREKSTTSALEATKSAITAAQVALISAQKDIERLKIRAPFSGLLEADTAELGSLLQPGSLCSKIIQLNPIKLIGYVPETAMSKAALGADASARFTSGQEVSGKVTFLSRSADPKTRTFRVEITVANDDLSISDGQTADIIISAARTVAHMLPQSALTLNNDGLLGVRVDRGGKALFVPVKILRDTIEGVWTTGLEDTETVIIVGQEYVSDGTPVVSVFRENSK